MSNVETLYEVNMRDIVAMLRQLADSVEQGLTPARAVGIVCDMGPVESPAIYAFGDTDGRYHAIGMFSCAVNALTP